MCPISTSRGWRDFRDENSRSRQYTTLCLASWLRFSKYQLQLIGQIVRHSSDSACFWHVSYLCSQNIITSLVSPASHTWASLISTLHLRPLLVSPGGSSFWHTGKFHESLLLNLLRGRGKTNCEMGIVKWNEYHVRKSSYNLLIPFLELDIFG